MSSRGRVKEKAWYPTYLQIKGALPSNHREIRLESLLKSIAEMSEAGKLPPRVTVAAYGMMYAIYEQRAECAVVRRLYTLKALELTRVLARISLECTAITYVPNWIDQNINPSGELFKQ